MIKETTTKVPKRGDVGMVWVAPAYRGVAESKQLPAARAADGPSDRPEAAGRSQADGFSDASRRCSGGRDLHRRLPQTRARRSPTAQAPTTTTASPISTRRWRSVLGVRTTRRRRWRSTSWRWTPIQTRRCWRTDWPTSTSSLGASRTR